MKTILYTLLSISIIGLHSANGQISFTANDLPQPGDRLVSNTNTNTAALSAGGAGANVTWDFTGFLNQQTNTTSFAPPSAFASSSLFPDATLASTVGSTASILYSQVTDNGLFTLGAFTGDPDLGIDTFLVTFDPPRLEIKLPLNYQDTFSANTVTGFVISDIGSGTGIEVVQRETSFNEVDAYGTVSLSHGDYQALRVKSTVTSIDSSFLISDGIRQFFSEVIAVDTTYDWIALESGGPLVSMEASGIDPGNVSVTIIDVPASSIGGGDTVLFPVADFRAIDLASGQYLFSDRSTNGPTSWDWDFGDGNSSMFQNPSHTYERDGDFQVCLVVANEAGADTSCQIITVDGLKPLAGFSFQDNGDGLVAFSNTTTGANNTYTWDFGDGNSSAETSPIHVYPAIDSTYEVCLIATNPSGADTLCRMVQVSRFSPITDFTVTDQGMGSFAFTDQSSNEPVVWIWDFGDGNVSSSQNPEHTYQTEGSYTVCLTTTNSVGIDSSCQVLVVDNLLPDPAFTFQDAGPATIQFSDQSTNDPQSWLWDFGDGNTSNQQNPEHTYATEGQYTVCLTTTNTFGSDSTCATVAITNLVPMVSFSTDSVGLGTIQFTDLSTNTPTSWLWDFGDGNTSTTQNPTHTFPAEGNYTVCLTSTNSFGSDSSCASVLIQGIVPVVDFSITALDSGQIQFTDLTSNMPNSWLWDFGDGNTSFEQNPIHSYISTGDYTVCLTATNAFATDSSCAVVSVVITNLATSLPGTSLLIGPNPFNGQFNVQLQGQLPNQPLRMQVFSSNGQLMGKYLLRDQMSIATNDWPSGSYWLQLRDEQGNRVLETQVIKR